MILGFYSLLSWLQSRVWCIEHLALAPVPTSFWRHWAMHCLPILPAFLCILLIISNTKPNDFLYITLALLKKKKNQIHNNIFFKNISCRWTLKTLLLIEISHTQGTYIIWFHLYKTSRVDKYIEIESRQEVTRGWEDRGNVELLLNNYWIPVWSYEKELPHILLRYNWKSLGNK